MPDYFSQQSGFRRNSRSRTQQDLVEGIYLSDGNGIIPANFHFMSQRLDEMDKVVSE
jgi:hypothetical protein